MHGLPYYQQPTIEKHLVTKDKSTLTHTIIQSPQFTSGFTLGVVHSVSLDKCIITAIHHWNITEYVHCTKTSLCSIKPSSPPLPAANTDLSTVSIVLPFPKCHIIGITQHVPFQIAFFHLVICIWISSVSFHGLIVDFLFSAEWYSTFWMYQVYLPIHLLKDILGASNLGKLLIKLLQTTTRSFFVCVDVSFQLLWVNISVLLKCMLRVYWVLLETTKLVFKVAGWFCIPSSHEWGCLLLCILISRWSCQWPFSNRCGVVSHYYSNLHFSDVHISLMTYDVEHLFICLFTICISSLLRILASMFMRDIGLYFSFLVGSLVWALG